MPSFPFDTLGASKRLQEAGMPEGMAEAVVSEFQHALTPDLSSLATKADLDASTAAGTAELNAAIAALRADLHAHSAATASDFEAIRQEMATKADMADIRLEIARTHAAINDTIRQQGWLLLGGVVGGVGVLLTLFTGIGQVLG
ncbi:MAG: hypothetical protein ACOY4K_12585 [Pseudomonadota bacterium]